MNSDHGCGPGTVPSASRSRAVHRSWGEALHRDATTARLHTHSGGAMATVVESRRSRAALAGVLLFGCAVAVALGVYGREHDLGSKPLFFDLSDLLKYKSWFATVA